MRSSSKKQITHSMKQNAAEILNQNCLFTTERIALLHWNHIESRGEFKDHIESVLEIMTPEVAKALPDGWQNLTTQEEAKNWIEERKGDSHFFAVVHLETKRILGYLFLYVENETQEFFDLRLGYLLAKSTWGKGIGSELIKALVEWGKQTGKVRSISGGVEQDNIGSIKVLEKNGFYLSDEELPGDALLYTIDC